MFINFFELQTFVEIYIEFNQGVPSDFINFRGSTNPPPLLILMISWPMSGALLHTSPRKLFLITRA
jgi:hypothetical protein